MRLPHLLLTSLAWAVSLAWLARTLQSLAHSGELPDLLQQPEPAPLSSPGDAPLLSVVVPACNEEQAIAATVRSLLASRGLALEVIAVDDRSRDRTGSILDALAQEQPSQDKRRSNQLQVLHVDRLPEGWLGKPHALAQGVARTQAPYLLFTDADILFRDDTILRALTYLQQHRLDYLVLAATAITKSPGERMVLGALQAVSIWATRLWKIADPRAKESIGVGSFGLVTREAYDRVGGWQQFRFEVLEDLRFGWELKRRHGMRQQIAFGPGLLRLHWGAGASGLVRNITKNGFALFRYRLPFAVLALASLPVLLFAPLLALAGPRAMRWAFAPFALALMLLYRRDIGRIGVWPWHLLTYPAGAALFLYALARSISLTLLRGGVEWRGTLYPLRTLRALAGPLR